MLTLKINDELNLEGYEFKIYEDGYKYSTPNSNRSAGNEKTLINAFKGYDAINEWWEYNFNILENTQKQIIEAVFPDIHQQGNKRLKQPERVYNVALKRLAKTQEELMKPCSRCGTTGHYSYNQRSGTVCFKCSGLKYTLPKVTAKWITKVHKYFKTLET
ncbi:hypothetical protein [Clostridium estertheticum]|uniref:hypothetical protein n=1 Tax=Clostridium estertheticum TaxID=238834 RepID=UPI001C0BB6DF|nr:hypothetical protein [Clostridium estertheticum]MBU3173329.1 hypothetical protein [Clostridium estertheticum]